MGDKLSVNPWIGIWVRPRATLQAILAYNKSYLLPLLYWIYGMPLFLQAAQNMSLGERFPLGVILGGAVIGAFIIGFIGINLGALLFHWTGRWIGGVGSFKDVRAAVAWASVPHIVAIATWIVQVLMFGHNTFSLMFFKTPLVGTSFTIMYLCSIVSMVAMVWGVVILLKALGQAQQFSAWKALLNVFLPFVIIFIGLKLLIWLSMLMPSATH